MSVGKSLPTIPIIGESAVGNPDADMIQHGFLTVDARRWRPHLEGRLHLVNRHLNAAAHLLQNTGLVKVVRVASESFNRQQVGSGLEHFDGAEYRYFQSHMLHRLPRYRTAGATQYARVIGRRYDLTSEEHRAFARLAAQWKEKDPLMAIYVTPPSFDPKVDLEPPHSVSAILQDRPADEEWQTVMRPDTALHWPNGYDPNSAEPGSLYTHAFWSASDDQGTISDQWRRISINRIEDRSQGFSIDQWLNQNLG